MAPRKENFIYYAHSLNLYNKQQEYRDLKLIEQIFPNFVIINPNTDYHIQNYLNTGMNYFLEIIKNHCDILVFRGLVNGKIGAGVYAEIECADKNCIPVIELPIIFSDRVMSISDTKKYLECVGQR